MDLAENTSHRKTLEIQIFEANTVKTTNEYQEQ